MVYDRWHGWWRAEHLAHDPQFPFGFGLSYTTFEIADVEIEHRENGDRVVCTVANTGDRDGAEVVQVYARFADPEVPRRLVGFRRVEVAAGASAHVEIDIPADRFLQRDPATRSWRPPAGTVELTVARNATDSAGPS